MSKTSEGGIPGKTGAPRRKEPTARSCPLVLDGEMNSEEFSPRACYTCDEFDCSFWQGEPSSGDLCSRTFVADEDEPAHDEWGEDTSDGGEQGYEGTEDEDTL